MAESPHLSIDLEITSKTVDSDRFIYRLVKLDLFTGFEVNMSSRIIQVVDKKLIAPMDRGQ